MGLTLLDQQEYNQVLEDKPQLHVEWHLEHQRPTADAAGVVLPLQTYQSSPCQHDVVTLFAGLASLTTPNVGTLV